jgi:hypothetical protein
VAKVLGSKVTTSLEGRSNLPRMEDDSEILEPEEVESLVEHLPPRHVPARPQLARDYITRFVSLFGLGK